MEKTTVPDIVVSRLPRYLQALEHMHREGVNKTSSQELGEAIGISAAQIRKDLSQFGEFGKQGTGYSVPYLVDQLQTILNLDKSWDLALIGMGDLGNALARYQGFVRHGFRIAAIFDIDPEKIGKEICGLTVQDMIHLPDEICAKGIRIAMLTVPASVAQQVAELLIQAGIRSILNYAPISLNLPAEVHVENIDPILKLRHMTFYLNKETQPNHLINKPGFKS
ncbi:MAG: redox-sensing transcriptional repressor Rex [Chloroflexota bacterium]|jgi:redox-sensing transcriptional repressor